MSKLVPARCFVPPKLILSALFLCGFVLMMSPAAAQTDSLKPLREALQSRPSVWGEARVGTRTGAEPDAQAVAVAQALGHGLRLVQPKPAPAPPPAGVNQAAAQQAAIRLLRTQAGPDLEVHLRAANQTVMQIRGGVLERAAAGVAKARERDQDERTARNFLRASRALLRLEDPDTELRLETHARDDGAQRHLRFSQTYHELPVWPSGLSVHLDAGGQVNIVDAAYVPTPNNILKQPIVSPIEATERAKASVRNGNSASTSDPELIVHAPLGQPCRLAWKFNLSTDILHAWLMVVDAEDGRILRRNSLVLDANLPVSAKDLEGAAQNLNIWSENGKFYLADTTKQMFSPAFSPLNDPHGVITIFDARDVTIKDFKTAYIVESAASDNLLPDGTSALFNFGHTYDYFLERHNRNSLDGNAGNIQAIVRIAQMDNAFWNGNLKLMFFGNVRPYPLALDVVAHELTHGVTENTAGLIYELQSGAMNEAFSDIFGTMVEARINGQVNWTLGEKLGKVFRDLQNPGSLQIQGLNRPFPSKMSEFLELPNSEDSDHGGVHLNSSIINHAFYLYAEGLPGAVGLRDAEKVFYRCLTTHLQKQSQFIDARLGCIASAEALFGTGAPQAIKAAEAFDAVEILATPPTPEPSPIPTVSGEDSTLFVAFDLSTFQIALGRRETVQGDPNDGVAIAEGIKEARPSVSGDGTVAVFVTGDNNVCALTTDDPNSLQCLDVAGFVHSVAISPDANRIAFVLRDPFTAQPDNRVSVYDLARDTTFTFDLLAPVVDGSPVDNVLYADSLVFTADSRQLIYDAVSEIRFGGHDPVERWSLFRIDLATESTTVLVPPFEGLDTGNPNIGRAGNRYLTFDARDAKTGQDVIVNLDLFTGEFAEVGSVGNGVGYPCFTGDESAVIFASQDPNAFSTGFSLVRQPLAANRLGKDGQPSLWVEDSKIGVIYRRGTFNSSNALPVSTLTAPANNSTFQRPATITITANATDADGAVMKVEFYEGANKLGESAAAPFSFAWANVPAGNYRVIARAYDNLGGVSDSPAVNVIVTPESGGATIKVSATRTDNDTFRMTVTAPVGNYTLQKSSDLKNWTDQMPVTIGASGSTNIDAATIARSDTAIFYRVRKN